MGEDVYQVESHAALVHTIIAQIRCTECGKTFAVRRDCRIRSDRIGRKLIFFPFQDKSLALEHILSQHLRLRSRTDKAKAVKQGRAQAKRRSKVKIKRTQLAAAEDQEQEQEQEQDPLEHSGLEDDVVKTEPEEEEEDFDETAAEMIDTNTAFKEEEVETFPVVMDGIDMSTESGLALDADGLFGCHICGGQEIDLDSLVRHINDEHYHGQLYRCQDCGLVFERAAQLARHVAVAHHESDLEDQDQDDDPDFTC